MLPTACKPAIASLRDSWKRKEKEGKTSETNLVSNGTTTNTKTGHTKKNCGSTGSTRVQLPSTCMHKISQEHVTPEESHLKLGLSWSASSSRT